MAIVPDPHVAGSIAPFADGALIIDITERMIGHCHCKTLVRRIERRPFGNRPRFQDAVDLKAKVKVEIPGMVFVYYKSPAHRLSLQTKKGRLVCARPALMLLILFFLLVLRLPVNDQCFPLVAGRLPVMGRWTI